MQGTVPKHRSVLGSVLYGSVNESRQTLKRSIFCFFIKAKEKESAAQKHPDIRGTVRPQGQGFIFLHTHTHAHTNFI